MNRERIALSIELTATAEGKPPSEFRLFKPGKNKTTKGTFVYSEASEKACAEFAAEMGRELMIDYEHASLRAEHAIDPAKAGEAAGWFSVDARKDGLWATNVSWTDDAAARLSARKFRYFSPVITFDTKTKEVTGVFNAALTGNPATLGQAPLVASITTQEKPPMLKLATLVSLAADATEDAIAVKVEKLRDERELLMASTGKSTVAEATSTIAAWKSGAETATVLTAKLAQAEAAAKQAEVDAVVKKAVEEKRATPAMVATLTSMGLRDLVELKGFIEALPKVVGEPAKQKSSNEASTTLSAEELQVCKLTNTKPEDFAKTKARLAAAAQA